jgi:hypothetical protein
LRRLVAVMRTAGDGAHGRRLLALIVVLWRAGLRLQEALALAEADLDYRRGALLVRRGKGGRRREVGMDTWGWEELQPWLELRVRLPVGPSRHKSPNADFGPPTLEHAGGGRHTETEHGDGARLGVAEWFEVNPVEGRGRKADPVAQEHREDIDQNLVDEPALQALAGQLGAEDLQVLTARGA